MNLIVLILGSVGVEQSLTFRFDFLLLHRSNVPSHSSSQVLPQVILPLLFFLSLLFKDLFDTKFDLYLLQLEGALLFLVDLL